MQTKTHNRISLLEVAYLSKVSETFIIVVVISQLRTSVRKPRATGDHQMPFIETYRYPEKKTGEKRVCAPNEKWDTHRMRKS